MSIRWHGALLETSQLYVFCTEGSLCISVEAQITTDACYLLLFSLVIHTWVSGKSWNKGNSQKIRMRCSHLSVIVLLLSCVTVSFVFFHYSEWWSQLKLTSPPSLCLCRLSPQWHSNWTRHIIRARGHPQGGHQLRPLQDNLRHLRLWKPRYFLLRACGGAVSLPDSQAWTGTNHNIQNIFISMKDLTAYF